MCIHTHNISIYICVCIYICVYIYPTFRLRQCVHYTLELTAGVSFLSIFLKTNIRSDELNNANGTLGKDHSFLEHSSERHRGKLCFCCARFVFSTSPSPPPPPFSLSPSRNPQPSPPLPPAPTSTEGGPLNGSIGIWAAGISSDIR